jgi:hypothetical protein
VKTLVYTDADCIKNSITAGLHRQCVVPLPPVPSAALVDVRRDAPGERAGLVRDRPDDVEVDTLELLWGEAPPRLCGRQLGEPVAGEVALFVPQRAVDRPYPEQRAAVDSAIARTGERPQEEWNGERSGRVGGSRGVEGRVRN